DRDWSSDVCSSDLVIVEAGIKDARHAKSAGARNQPERSQPSLRAGNRHVITGRDFPLLRKLFADKQGLDTVWIGRKVQLARDNALECLIAFSFALGINALGHYAVPVRQKRARRSDKRPV